MNLASAQLMFKICYFLTPTVRGNFKNDERFREEMWRCPDCVSLAEETATDSPSTSPPLATGSLASASPPADFDSQSHLMVDCVANQDLRVGRDMGKPQDLIDFFRDLITRRKEKYAC